MDRSLTAGASPESGAFIVHEPYSPAYIERRGPLLLRVALAVIFIWFGILKPLGLSPAASLVEKTVFWWPSDIFVPVLGIWEVAAGLCLLWHKTLKIGLVLLFLQLPGTAFPLFIVPDICFNRVPFELTLEGQYILKNVVLIAASAASSEPRSTTRPRLLDPDRQAPRKLARHLADREA